MKKYKIYADTHLMSPIEILVEEVINEPKDPNTIFLGDIIDAANCKKSEVHLAKKAMDDLILRHGENYISGNHSRNFLCYKDLVKDGVVFTHGDLEADFDKWAKYRFEPWGASNFKRTFIIPFIREAEKIVNRRPKESFLEAAAKLALNKDCHTYVCGHFHPDKLIDTVYKGIRIVIVPRGITQIAL